MKEINYLGESQRVPLDLKSTINLPKTDFPMKANLPQNEPKILARWEQMEHLWPHSQGPARSPDAMFYTMALPMPMGQSILAMP